MAATATIAAVQATANSLQNNPSASFPGTDYVVLAGERMLGSWVLMPGAKAYGWEERKGFALSGAFLVITGDPLVHATFLVRFRVPLDWENFKAQRARLLKKPVYSVKGNRNYAMGLQHPELNALGVDAVVVGKNPWFTNTGKGLWVGQVEFIQYRPGIPALENPRAKIPALPGPQPSAQDSFEQEQLAHQQSINRLRSQ